MTPTRLALLLSASLATAGCSSTAGRIRANAAEFDRWPSEIQEKVRAGVVEPGFRREMVEVALGIPDRVYPRTFDGVEEEVWAYTAVAAGPQTAGPPYDPRTDPPSASWGAPRVFEKLRVAFRQGLVHSVEELPPPAVPGFELGPGT